MAPLFLEQLGSPSLPWTRAAMTPHATPKTLAVHYTIALLILYFRLQVWKRCPNLVLVPRADTDTCFRDSPGEKLSYGVTWWWWNTGLVKARALLKIRTQWECKLRGDREWVRRWDGTKEGGESCIFHRSHFYPPVAGQVNQSHIYPLQHVQLFSVL